MEIKNNPGFVEAKEFKLHSRLKARLGFNERFGIMFLGYCCDHKKYYLDREHSNGFRCPVCFTKWLKKEINENNNLYNKKYIP